MDSSKRTSNNQRMRRRVIYAIWGLFALMLLVSQHAESAMEFTASIAACGYTLMPCIFMLPVVMLLVTSPRNSHRYDDMLSSAGMFFLSPALLSLILFFLPMLLGGSQSVNDIGLLLVITLPMVVPYLLFFPDGKRRFGSYWAMLARCAMWSFRYVAYGIVFIQIVLSAIPATQLATQQSSSFLLTLLRLCVLGFPYVVIVCEIAVFHQMFKDISTRGETTA